MTVTALSRSPELGSQVRQVAMVSEPERSKLWDLNMFTFQGAAVRRLELRSGVTTLTYFHISRVVSFLHSIPFRFSWCLSCCFFGLKWDIRHNETHAIDESTTTRSSSQLLNLIFCDVPWWWVMMSNMSPWVVPFMSPFPLSCQSQNRCSCFFLSAVQYWPIFFPLAFPFCFACVRLPLPNSFHIFWPGDSAARTNCRCQRCPPIH